MQEYGYFYDGMLPVTRERALELDAAGLTVYVLHEDNTESMVFDPQEIMEHPIIGVAVFLHIRCGYLLIRRWVFIQCLRCV